MKKFRLMISCFRSEEQTNHLVIGEGFSLVEAIVRGVEIRLNDEILTEAIRDYGPEDFAGLYEWYNSRGIVLSEPFIIEQP